MSEEETRLGLDCCIEFLCGECPYKKYASNTFSLKCLHKLLEDLKEMMLSDVERRFLIECLELSSRESYHSVLSFDYLECAKLGTDIARKLGTDEDALNMISIEA